MKREFVLVLPFLCICGCQPKIDSRGNVTLAEKINTFAAGKTRKEDILSACGAPSLQRSNEVWIYMGARAEEVSFKDIEMKNKLVVRFVFDKDGVLRKIEKVRGDNYSMSFDAEVTKLTKK